MLDGQNVMTLDLKEEGVCYKMYLPYKDTDYIQRVVNTTQKPYEYEMLQEMPTRIPKDSTLLDIGMNIGNHSLFFAANGRNVIAFEANPKMSAIAKESIRLNGFEDRIKVYEYGLSDKEEEAFFAKENPHNYGAMALTLGKPGGGGIICKPLDSFGIEERIAAIKIDIEGMESLALKGGVELINKNRPIIYAEAHHAHEFKKLDRVLFGLNYIHWDIFGDSPTHLYLPREQVSLEEMIAKGLSSMAPQRLYWGNYKHSTWIHEAIWGVYVQNSQILQALQNLQKPQ